MFIPLDTNISVAGQIGPDDIATAQAQGVTTVLNNRPDGEQAGQPTGDEIEAAAAAAGMAYLAIPVTHAGIAPEQVDQMAAALEAANGPVLAFCRSGTRSTMLWALAEAKRGREPEALAALAAAAGYDVGGLMPAMRALQAGR